MAEEVEVIDISSNSDSDSDVEILTPAEDEVQIIDNVEGEKKHLGLELGITNCKIASNSSDPEVTIDSPTPTLLLVDSPSSPTFVAPPSPFALDHSSPFAQDPSSPPPFKDSPSPPAFKDNPSPPVLLEHPNPPVSALLVSPSPTVLFDFPSPTVLLDPPSPPAVKDGPISPALIDCPIPQSLIHPANPVALIDPRNPPVSIDQNQPITNDKCMDAINELLETITKLPKKIAKTKEKERIHYKMTRKYTKIKSSPTQSFTEEVEKELADLIKSVSDVIASDPKETWNQLGKLFESMRSANNIGIGKSAASKRKNASPTNAVEEEEKKKARIDHLEKRLKLMEEDIAKRGEEEVDLDDEDNSSYLVRDRQVTRYLKHYKTLCDLNGCSTSYFGRPIQKKIVKIGTGNDNLTDYPDLNETVLKYFNSQIMQNSHYFPDFVDIMQLVTDFKNSSLLLIDALGTEELAKTIFEKVAETLKLRRDKDLFQVLQEEDNKDPAEEDPELARKLEYNKSNARKEEEVMMEFVDKQNNLYQNSHSPLTGSDSEISDGENDADNEGEDGSDNEKSDTEMEDMGEEDSNLGADIQIVDISD